MQRTSVPNRGGSSALRSWFERGRLGRGRLVVGCTVLVALAGAAQACGSRPGKGVVGISERPPGGGAGRASSDGGVREGGTALPLDYQTTLTKLTRSRFVSTGHAAGRWEVEVWGNDLTQKALAARARDVPVGAVVVSEHFERNGARAQGPIMVMEKRPKGFAPEHGDWRFAVVNSTGQVVRDGVVESCAGCHDDAPMDGLFPIVD